MVSEHRDRYLQSTLPGRHFEGKANYLIAEDKNIMNGAVKYV